MNKVIQHIRSIALLQAAGERTDGQLLESFVRRREAAALEALVRRHSSMVWGVCRRILHNHHDAEDAFQATSLVLVRKAARVKPRQMVGNWLYGVAHQTALKARATRAKRQTRERQVAAMPEPAVTEPGLWRDLQPVLDQELSRFPDKYRVAIVLCDLEGKTRKEAAGQLRCPEGTVAGRLARARIILAKRLTRRGIVLSCAALAAVLSQQAASAVVPTSVAASTIKAASLLAAGKAAATGAISAKVAALTEGVLKAMLITKLKTVLAVVLILGFVATGATVLTCRTAVGQEDKPALAEKPVKASPKQEEEKDGFTAWGKEVGGLQGGLGYLPGQKRAYSPGETVKLVVRVRNVSKEEIKFQYLREFFIETPPTVTDGTGKPVPLGRANVSGLIHLPVDVSLASGKEIELTGSQPFYELELELKPASLYGTGKFQLQYERVFGDSSSGGIKIDPRLSKLATGKLELEIKEGEPAKPPQKQEKEGFTVWGKEVGGLQAGLGFRPGEHRTYYHGEPVTLVVRVRNVSKEAVKFQYLRNFFMEKPPTVTDGEGKPVPFAYGVFDLAAVHLPVDVNLAPGKEFELYEWKLELRPAGESGQAMISTLYGTGKFLIQYKRVFGNSSAGKITLDSALSKLATGKLELEVKAGAPPAATEVKTQVKKVMVKENYTSWAKEVGGLQAGLGYRAGERRAYHHGETVTLVVRVRNVSKEEVKFSYLHPYIEHAPTVTDSDGKPVPQPTVIPDIGARNPGEVNLAPGKEIELCELNRQLRPASENDGRKDMRPYALFGTGKLSVQYEQVLGLSSMGAPGWKLDPALSKLATGKLELEVKPEAAPKDDNEDNKPANPRVIMDKGRVTVEGQLDEASTLVLRIGEEKDKLFWEARRKETPGSAMVRFSEEGAKRFWGDKTQSVGAFKAVVELSDKILMSDGKFATGFIYSVAISEGAATEKQSLIGSIIYVPIPKTGSLQDFLARSLAGDAMPFGQLSLREESKVVRKDGVVTFADIQKGDGKLVPVSFVFEKSHSSLRKEPTVTK